MTADEYNEICQEMLAFQEHNNRLSYSDDGSMETEQATVADKSFEFREDQPKVEPAVAEQSKGGVKDLFRS